MAQNQVYLIKSGENSFVEETQAIVGISGGKVGIGTTHPEADLHVTGSVKVGGDLTVDGTLTTINSTTVSVDDKNIELGSTDNPTDVSAEGGGITVKGANDKTFNWYAASGWTSSENLSVADGRHFAGDELRALDADGLSLFDTNQSGITIKGGKVGIHQAAPGYDLDVDGSGNFGSLYVDGNAVLTGEGSIFGKWEDGATQGEIFYTGGNVGVGTTNPEHNFHVVGNGVVDGNFVVNGTSGTFNVGEFDVSGSNITLNSAGGGLDSSRGGLIVNGDNGTGKLEYLDSTQTWQSNQDIQIVADKHLQTDKVRAIDDEGLYLQDDGGNGIYIQDGGNVNIAKQVNVVGLTKADGGLNVGNGKFNIQSDGTLGSVNPNADDVIKWDGTKWVAAVSPGGGGGGTSEVPNALINSLIAGESIQQITYGPYDSTPKIATDLEIVGDGSVIPYALSGVSETGYFAVFSQEIPNNNYKIHTVFGGKDVYWETGSSSSIYYNDGDVSLQRNLTIGGNLTVAGSTTSINTQTLEIEDHNIVIASNTGYNQLTDVYPVGGDYAGVFWGTGDAGAASPVSLTYQSNKGFAFEGGNVGIGETAPVNPLHILVDTVDTQEFTTSGNGGAIFLESNSPSSQGEYGSAINFTRREGSSHRRKAAIVSKQYGGDGEDVGLAFFTANGDTESNSNVGEVLQLRGNGDAVFNNNVGIGTTSPTANLHIGSNTSGSQWIRLDTQYGMFSIGNGSAGSPAQKYFSIYDQDVNQHRLFISNAGNVGIGTTSPSAKLHVDLGGTGTIAEFRGADTDLLHIDGDSNQITLDARNVGALAFEMQGSEAMRINSSGNVGIGTTSPDAKLHVDSGEAELTFGNNASGGNANLRIWRNDSSIAIDNPLGYLSFAGSDAATSPTDHAAISAIAEESHEYTSDPLSEKNGTQLTFFTTNLGQSAMSRKMTISANGNVGIGTTSPSAKLHVNSGDAGTFTPNTNADDLLVEGDDNTGITIVSPDDKYSGIILSSPSDPTGSIIEYNYDLKTFDIGTSTNQGVLRFRSGSFATAMQINSDGNVGIGTTNPQKPLHISANAHHFVLEDTNAAAGEKLRGIHNNNNHLHIGRYSDDFNDFTTDLIINNQGNVGIGTANPGGKLHIATKDTLISGTVSTVSSNLLTASGSSFLTELSVGDSLLIEGKDTYTVTAINSETQVQLSSNITADGGEKLYRTNNKNLFFISEKTRNVGIGTTNPGAKLDIKNGSGVWLSTNNLSSRADFTMAGQNYANLTDQLPTDENSFEIGRGYINLNRDDDKPINQLSFAMNGTLGAAIEVGGGTPSSPNNQHSLRFKVGRDNLDNKAGIERMRITHTGNVGIGTTNPGSSLHVKGSNNTVFDNISNVYLEGTDTYNSSNAGAGIQFGGKYDTSGNTTVFGQISAIKENILDGDYKGALTFGTRDGASLTMEAMRIDSDGNVGIGTTDPGAKLQLQGDFLVSNSTDNSVLSKIWIQGTSSASGDGHIIFQNNISTASRNFYIGNDITDGAAAPNGLSIKSSSYNITSWADATTRLHITNSGNVGIGTTDPGSYKLNVNGTTFCTSGTWSGSDDRIKHNEQPIIGALETISKITPKKYIKTTEMYDADHDFELDADGNPVDSNGEPVEHRIEAGVIAQQVLTIDELAFAVSPEGVDEDGTVTSPHGLDYNSLFTYAIAAIQEQQQLIEQLKSQNESLAARISALES